jgi:HEPN domain-containing protein
MSDPEVSRLTGEWLRYAREDLESAERMLASRDAFEPRHVCFAAQQAAEKAIKAACVARQIRFPFVHDLGELIALLGPHHEVTQAADDLDRLSQWAVQPRYPGDDEPDWPDAERAVAEARPVVEAAIEAIG